MVLTPESQQIRLAITHGSITIRNAMPHDSQKIVQVLQNLLRSTRGKLGTRWAIVLLLAVGGYLFAEPALESRMGVDLPGIHTPGDSSIENTPQVPDDSSGNRKPSRSDSSPTAGSDLQTLSAGLEQIGRETYQSESGLVYARGSFHGHRLKHLMSHAKDNPTRQGQHGVFDETQPEELLRLVDEVYLEALEGNYTDKDSERGREIYTVDLGKRIGYIGGESGNRRNRPPARHVRLVVDGEKFITAYPIRP